MAKLRSAVGLLFLLVGCDWIGVPPKVAFVVEDGFKGPILIVEHPTGQTPSEQGDRIVVPGNGVVFLSTLRVLEESHRLAAQNKSGIEVPVYTSDVRASDVALRTVGTSVCDSGPRAMIYVLGDAKAEAALRSRCVIWEGTPSSLPRMSP